jgi:hypothetical protein
MLFPHLLVDGSLKTRFSQGLDIVDELPLKLTQRAWGFMATGSEETPAPDPAKGVSKTNP